MKRTILTLAAIAALALAVLLVGCKKNPPEATAGGTTSSVPTATSSAKTPTATTADAGAERVIGNAKNDEGKYVCPVMGNVIADPDTAPSAEYEGKTYYFCCNDCPAPFNADPEKYVSKISQP